MPAKLPEATARLNHVLEELGVRHEEHAIPPEVLTSIEDKKKKAAAKNTMATVESRKRRGGGALKAAAKRAKVVATSPASAESSASASVSSAEVSAAHSGGGADEPMMGVDSGVPSMVSSHGVPTPEAPGVGAAAGIPEAAGPEAGAAHVEQVATASVAPQTGAAAGPSTSARPPTPVRPTGSALPAAPGRSAPSARPAASVADPMPSLLGEESSSSEGAEVAGRVLPSTTEAAAPGSAVAPSGPRRPPTRRKRCCHGLFSVVCPSDHAWRRG